MMDSHDTNQPLNPGELEEEKKTVEVSETITETPTEETNAEKQPETAPRLATKEEVLVRMKELAQDAENANKQELDSLKQSFYKIHNAEQEAARKLFVENGGSEEDYVPQSDAIEEEFKNVMAVIKEKRSAQVAELEKQKEENLQIKLSIIEELKELVESPDDANKSYTEFKKLQQQWNETKLVPQAKVNELWKNYQLYNNHPNTQCLSIQSACSRCDGRFPLLVSTIHHHNNSLYQFVLPFLWHICPAYKL